mmetsp:Transcript_65/g.175  ORF Transcript_65/g.175 Transcript_65/m.175 type:complete len:197 (+) Transcript_65:77-667(+)
MVLASDGARAAGLALAVTLCGAAYVLVHEHRRKQKKLRPKQSAANADEQAAEQQAQQQSEQGAPVKEGLAAVVNVIEKDVLIATLYDTATAAYSLIEQTRRAVYQLHTEKGYSVDDARKMVHDDFQSNMATVLRAVQHKHSVTEMQIAASHKYYKDDARVNEAFAIMQNAMNGEAPPPPRAQAVTRTGKARRRGGR